MQPEQFPFWPELFKAVGLVVALLIGWLIGCGVLGAVLSICQQWPNHLHVLRERFRNRRDELTRLDALRKICAYGHEQPSRPTATRDEPHVIRRQARDTNVVIRVDRSTFGG